MASAPPPASRAGVAPGDVLAGKYRVERVLGEGGMGIVLAAHHLQLDTRVAIKLMPADVVASADALARFTREARAAAKITTEHIARVLDVGTLESGAPFIVMEFLEGGDLPPGSSSAARSRSNRRWSSCSRPASRWPRPIASVSSIAISSRQTCSASSAQTGSSRSR
jgi:serine/threonine protein kinase